LKALITTIIKPIMLFLLPIYLNSCLVNDPLNLAFRSFQPVDISDGLSISNASVEGIDSSALEDIFRDVYSDKDLWSLRSLLVFRNGKLVAESYLKDKNDITNRHLVWSCTKQVLGTLTGIAVEKGIINSIQDSISAYLSEELKKHPEKNNITIRHLLTMQSGIDYENAGTEGQTDKLLRQIPSNSIEFILSRPMVNDPGEEFYYKDGDPHLLSAIIQKSTGKATDLWADEFFFSKIGVSNYNWVRYKDGVTFGGFGIETSPRELSKIALCVADSGKWQGEQIVSAEWIDQMTKPQVDTDLDYDFGYYWWIDVEREIHFMWGHGGQFAFIIPQKNLVVVMTSIPNTQADHEINADEALEYVDRIIDICN